MPVTPFHLIAASPIKAIIPTKFSWSVFCLTNIIIDLEPITCFLITLEPRHLFFHTIIGATLVSMFAATYGRKLCEMTIEIWNEEIKDNLEAKWLTFNKPISKTAAWSGALIGAWTHLFLDSLMHDDIKPLSPFYLENPLLGKVEILHLHLICIGLSIIGVLVMTRKNFRLGQDKD